MDVSLLIRLIDQVSGPASKVRNALKKIGDGAKDVKSGLGDAIRQGFSVENIDTATKNAEAALQRSRGRLLGALAMATTLAAPIMTAGQFDQSMRGLDKVLDVTSSRLKELRKFALDTSATVPIAAGSLIELMSNAAQGGVPEAELERFSLYVAKASVAFDMAGAQIGDRFAKLRNVYKLNQEGIEDLGDATNHLSNNMAAKASELTDFANRAAGTAKTFNLSATQMTAFGAAMVAAGIAPETASSGVSALGNRVIAGGKAVDKAFKSIGMSRKTFIKDLQKDGPKALQTLFETMSKSPKGMEALIGLVGQDFSDDFSKLINNPELIAQAFKLIGDKQVYAGSATEEAAKQSQGAVKKWELLTNKLSNMAIVIGDRLLPEAMQLVDGLGRVVDQVTAFADANPELTKTAVRVVAGLLAFAIASRALSFVLNSLRLPLIGLVSTFLKFDASGRNVATGWRLLKGAGVGLSAVLRNVARVAKTANDRLGGLRNTMRLGIAAAWVIPMAFEIYDDLGRTPEQRLEQIRSNIANFKKVEQQLDQSRFGQWWQSLKDKANAAMGLESGEVPAEVFKAWLGRGWDSVAQFFTDKAKDIRVWASNMMLSVREGLGEAWAETKAWFQQKLSDVTGWLNLKGEQLSAAYAAGQALGKQLIDGISTYINQWIAPIKDLFKFALEIQWPEPPDWLRWLMARGGALMDKGGDALSKGGNAVSGWWDGVKKWGSQVGGGAPDGQQPAPAPTPEASSSWSLSGLWSGLTGAGKQAGDGLADGGQRGGAAVQQGGERAGDAMMRGAAAIENAASSLRGIAANSRRGGVADAISGARTGALHGGTD